MFAKLVLYVSLMCTLLMPIAAQPTPQVAVPVGAVGSTAAAEPLPQGTISGIVVERGLQTPIEGVQLLLVGPDGRQAASRSDPEGKFEIKVQPGGYQITARRVGPSGFIGVPTVKVVNVREDEEVETEIEVPQAAELSGRVLDARGEPVLGARVTLLMRSYEVWSTNIVYVNTPFSAQTNDLGEYFFEGIPTDIAFRAYAEIANPAEAEELATTAADPDLRRPILAGTFYPQSLDPAGAQPITLGEGERRERVDIEMVQTKSYCAEDVLLPVPPGEVPYTIDLDLASIVSGLFNGYGSFRSGRAVSLDKDGRARVCGLWPGTYRFTVQPQARMRGVIALGQTRAIDQQYYGGGEFLITDRDVTSLGASVGPTFDWEGSVTIDGPAPPEPIQQRLSVGFINITPTSLAAGVQSEIPGTFTLQNLHFDRELLRFGNLPTGWYVKSAMWGDDDLTQKGGRFYLGKVDVPLKVVVAADGSRINIRVTDDDGEPVVGARVNLVPGDIATAQELVAQLWNCYSDANGECTVFSLPNETPMAVLPPGEYMVLAAEIPYNQSAEVHDRIWQTLQAGGTKVTLPPGGVGEATIRRATLR